MAEAYAELVAEGWLTCAGFAPALRLLGDVLAGILAVESYGLEFHRELLADAGIRTVPLVVDEHGARGTDLTGTGATAVLLTPAHQFPHRRPTACRPTIGGRRLGPGDRGVDPGGRDDILTVKGTREFWTGVVDQLTLADFITCGGYDRQLRRMRQNYRHRRDQLVAAIAEHAPHVRVSGIAAGLHAVLELPPGTEQAALATAHREGLAMDGLSAYRHPDSTMPPRDGLVVGYATPPHHSFTAALHALCRALPDPP